jgi:hypothetical protein
MAHHPRSFFIFLCALLILIALPAPGFTIQAAREKAPEDIIKLIAAAGGVKDYPEADNITVFEHVKVGFKANGDYVSTEHGLVKILTENGKKSYSTLEFGYHRRYQEVTIPLARVIYPDGTMMKIPADAIRDGTATDTQEMNIFEENFRRKTITIPDLAVGCSIEYEATTSTHALLKDNYADEFTFQGSEPLLEKTVTITGPADKPLQYVVKNGKVSFSEKKEGSLCTYRWEAKQVPMIVNEPGMVSMGDVATKLVVSTYKSWKEISRYGDSLNDGKIDTNPAMQAMVKKLTAGCTTDEEKILAIFRYISQNIRYMGSSMDVGSFIEPHKATYTFEKQYGVCRDKSVLFASMLKEIGIKCYDVLINVNIETVTEVPSIFFQHAICAVELKDGRLVIMDPTLELSSAFGEPYVGNHHVLLLTREGRDLQVLPPVPAEKSMGTITTETSLDREGNLTGKVHIAGTGYYDLVLRSVNREYPAVQFERLISRLGTRFHPRTSIGDVKSTDPVSLSTPYSLSFSFTTKNYWTPAGKYFLFSLPLATAPFDLAVGNIFTEKTKLKERKYPIDIFSTCGCRQSDRLALPEGFRVVSLPPPVTMKQGPVSLTLSTRMEGQTLVFDSDYRLEKSRLSPADYQDLRKVALALKKFGRTMVILEKK